MSLRGVFRLMKLSVAALLILPAALVAQPPPPLPPLKRAPQPTAAAISAADLMTRMYVFADDSMMGREAGTPGEIKATNYLATEAKRLGLTPAGDSGGYIQYVPMIRRAFDSSSTIAVDGTVLRAGVDFVVTSRTNIPSLEKATVIFGGKWPDTNNLLAPDQVRGKILVMTAA